jgi:hypothetical protein
MDFFLSKYSRWLTLSSLFILLPSALAFDKRRFYLSGAYFVTALVSANYWRRPEYGLRRNLDVVVSRTCLILILKTGWRTQHQGLGWILLVATGVCYRASFYLHDKKSAWWLLAHFLMHVFSCAGMCLAVF